MLVGTIRLPEIVLFEGGHAKKRMRGPVSQKDSRCRMEGSKTKVEMNTRGPKS